MNDLDIINLLKGKTYTLGWDAVVAYDRQKINHLLQQQYIGKLEAGTHFSPITWENKDKTIYFENVTLGAPLISFEKANTENSRASATLEFIDGNVIEKNSNDQVINYIRIRPGMGLSMKLKIDLTAGEGSVDEKGKVLVNFSEGSITQIELNLTDEIPAEVTKYFNSWLKKNEIIYELGKLSFQDISTKLVPKKFIIRTQCAPDADLLHASNYGDGAVLLFVATEHNPGGGSLPTNDYPWLIPEENSSTILVSSKTVVEYYIKPAMDRILTKGKWNLIRGTGDNDAFYLQASDDATIGVSYIKAHSDAYTAWSGTCESDKDGVEDFIYSLKGSTLSLNKESVSLNFDKKNKFYRNISGSISRCVPSGCPSTCSTVKAKFELHGDVIYDIDLDADNKSVNFKLRSNNAVIESDMEDLLDRALLVVGKMLTKKMHDLLYKGTLILENVPFQDIGIFAVDRVLFPGQNINQLESVSIPGDLILFGNIAPSLTSLVLSPLTETIAVGDEVTFTTNTEEEVTYTLSPEGAGHITSEGVYSAPDSISGGALNVTVTATTTENVSTSAHITVVSTPVLLSPSFIVLTEDNQYPIQFNAKVLGERGNLSWEVDSSDPDAVGSIDKKGLYTPPNLDKSGGYPKGYTYVRVTAATSDGEISNAYILLVSNKTRSEFNVLPSFVNLLPTQTQEFTAEKTEDFYPNTWTVYPELGKLSKPEEDDGVYSVNYTAPGELSDDNVTIIQAMEKNKPNRAGYSVINLNNKELEPWDLIDGVNILKVVNEAGTGSANLYKNNAHQAIIRVQFSGFHLSNSGNPKSVPVTIDDILPHLKLVDYVSGEPLDWESGEDWYYSAQPNQFVRLPVGSHANYQDVSMQRADLFTLYVSCAADAQSSSKTVAVQITLSNGTVISTAANAASGFDSSVTFHGLNAIDYSQVKNVTLMSNELEIVKRDILWGSHEVGSVDFVSREDKCQIKAADFIILPADKNIEKFHSFSIQQDQITNLDVSNFYYTWDHNNELVFNCLDDRIGKQCAILTKENADEVDGTTNMWFFGGKAKLNSGQIYFSTKQEGTVYRITMEKFNYGETRTDFPYFSLLKIFTPIRDIKPHRCKSAVPPLTLNLTDIYGNTGKLNVTWDVEKYYDKPNIS